MTAVDDDLSRAVVAYIGFNTELAPLISRERVVDVFGPERGEELLPTVEEIMTTANAVDIDWKSHDFKTAADVVVERVRERYPGLSADALKAIDWNFSFAFR